MINIIIWGPARIEIENKLFDLTSSKDTLRCVRTILDKAFYSGERLCVETAEIDEKNGKAIYTDQGRWNF